jgi:S-adenosylmethionine/arginine decarboxylase-like enzyme
VNKKEPWGISTSVDLYNCDIRYMTDADYIRDTVIQLCDLIEMKRFGDCQIIHFGEGNKEGFTMVQLIETSNLTAHFANDIKAIYFDIFSCKSYDPEKVSDFLARCFYSNEAKVHVTTRV